MPGGDSLASKRRGNDRKCRVEHPALEGGVGVKRKAISGALTLPEKVLRPSMGRNTARTDISARSFINPPMLGIQGKSQKTCGNGHKPVRNEH